MNLNVYTKTIESIFSANVKYVIPRFQREYSWEEEEITELWEDLISSIILVPENGENEEIEYHIDNLEYFIGPLVLIGEEGSKEFFIVDGQQRLTTITILLSALVSVFKDLGEEAAAKGIYYNFIEGKDKKTFKPFFKFQNESSTPLLERYIQNINKDKIEPIKKKKIKQSDEEKRLVFAYEFFKNKLKDEGLKSEIKFWDNISLTDEKKNIYCLEKLGDQVLKLKVIYITASNEDDAYTIFEILNARGKNLSSVDLIKNTIFKNLNSTYPNDESQR